MALTFGSLFAGIGGFDLGLERAGMVCRWQVEIDPFCQQVLAKHWPDVRRYGDVRDCGAHNLEPVDLICGGFPCQPHSVAGKRRGAEDDRDLWPEYRRIVTELQPRWVVGENVPGIRGTILDEVLSDLEYLDYETGTLVVPACAMDAPHRRERLFVVAHTVRWGFQPVRITGILAGTCGDIEEEAHKWERGWDATDHSGTTLAYTDAVRCTGWTNYERQKQTERNGLEVASRWLPEPGVGRVAHGVPHRVDRLRALGNAVVPQVAEWLGRRILEADSL